MLLYRLNKQASNYNVRLIFIFYLTIFALQPPLGSLIFLLKRIIIIIIIIIITIIIVIIIIINLFYVGKT